MAEVEKDEFKAFIRGVGEKVIGVLSCIKEAPPPHRQGAITITVAVCADHAQQEVAMTKAHWLGMCAAAYDLAELSRQDLEAELAAREKSRD